MNGEWAYYEQVFPSYTCDHLVQAFSDQEMSLGTIGKADGQVVDKNMRHSEITWVSRRDKHYSDLFSTIDACIDEANRKFFAIDYWYAGADSFQFTSYRAGGKQGEDGYYNLHQDTNMISMNGAGQRKISFTLQLSDPNGYQGGDFSMRYVSQHPPAKTIRQQGTLLIFPSLVFHQVSPVTQGVRYSLVGWYSGPAWR